MRALDCPWWHYGVGDAFEAGMAGREPDPSTMRHQRRRPSDWRSRILCMLRAAARFVIGPAR